EKIESSEAYQSNKTNNTSNRSPFTAKEWATIFYYAEMCNLTSNDKYLKDRIIAFVKVHDIDNSIKNIRVQYYTVKNSLYDLKYPIEKLEKIIPFLEKEYPKIVPKVKNDIIEIETSNDDF